MNVTALLMGDPAARERRKPTQAEVEETRRFPHHTPGANVPIKRVAERWDLARAIALYESGLSCDSVGAALGINGITVRGRLRGHVAMRPGGTPKLNAEKHEEIRAKRRAGYRLGELAQMYGVSKAAVSYIANGRPSRGKFR